MMPTHTALTVLSFGGGQDSTAILYQMLYNRAFRNTYAPAALVVVMAATGNEHPDTDAHVEACKALCATHGVAFEHLTFDRGFHTGPWKRGLAMFYYAKRAIGSVAFPKTCSSNLKIEPVRRWLKAYCADAIGAPHLRDDHEAVATFVARYGPVRMLLGIARGEESRVAKPDRAKWVNDCIRHEYPLLDLGLDRAACQAYIASCGHAVPPPSNCIFCPFKSAHEVLWTFRRYPAHFDAWAALEARKLDAYRHLEAVLDPKTGRPRNLNYGVKKLETLPQVLAKAQAAIGHLTDAQLDEYRMSHGHCVNTAF